MSKLSIECKTVAGMYNGKRLTFVYIELYKQLNDKIRSYRFGGNASITMKENSYGVSIEFAGETTVVPWWNIKIFKYNTEELKDENNQG